VCIRDSFLSLYVDIFSTAVGTKLMPDAQQQEVLSKFVLDHLQWAMITGPNKTFYDPSVVGRQISRKKGLDRTHNASKLIKLVSRWYSRAHSIVLKRAACYPGEPHSHLCVQR
jgi:hypothetical protein